MTLIKKKIYIYSFNFCLYCEVNEKQKLLLQQKLNIFVAQLGFGDALWSLLCFTGALLCEVAPEIIWKCVFCESSSLSQRFQGVCCTLSGVH